MDSPLATLVFKRLFSTCYCKRPRPSLRRLQQHSFHRNHSSIRSSSTYRKLRESSGKQTVSGGASTGYVSHGDDGRWYPARTELEPYELRAFHDFPHMTAEQLRPKSRRPRRVKMTMRDFIEDSLYNPAYGYFSSQAVIFNPGEPFDYRSYKDEPDFQRALRDRYIAFEDKLDEVEVNETRQLWHTPTELFRPHYAEAMARYFLANYKLALYPYHDLIIYEMGAGNGTFMRNVLDYIREMDPEVYARTKYKIIEISTALAGLQKSNVQGTAEAQGHADKVEIINHSIFEWKTYVNSPCFFVAMEVFDNFGHDVVRYDLKTGQPLQGTVLIDAEGEMYEVYTPQLDRALSHFLRVRDAALQTTPTDYVAEFRRRARRKSPVWQLLTGREELSERVYMPTRLMQFFDVLHTYFPAHRLLCSDFHSLPDATEGLNAPVVQTRYKRNMVPVTTPLVLQGYFDILFPTNFTVMEDMYRAITGKLTKVDSHADFMQRWAHLEETETRNGENPLLAYYENASVMTTV